MDYWGVMFGLGLLAATVGVIAFVRYRERESQSLSRHAELARELKATAGDDEVRLAAIDEFELAVYQRLFYASTVGPWIRSAAWALLGAVLAGAGALLVGPLDGVVPTTFYIALLVLAGVFAIATVAFAGTAVFHTASTPRVSFAESYESYDAEVPEPKQSRTSATPDKGSVPVTTDRTDAADAGDPATSAASAGSADSSGSGSD